MLYFATLFDINYLSRALVMMQSMKENSTREITFFILAMDKEVEAYFENQTDTIIIPLSDLEQKFPELNKLKTERSRAEYCFTLSPFYPLYILEKYDFVDRITSLDADLLFYDEVNTIFETYPNADVLITRHNFSKENLPAIKVGIYNVSFQSFKNNDNAINVLKDWKQKCTEWCKDTYDEPNQRYGDQKYLDFWQETFENIQAIEMENCGVAPWNVSKMNLNLKNCKFYVQNEPLLFYHFQSFRVYTSFICQHALKTFAVKDINKPIKQLYLDYFQKLKAVKIKGFDNQIGRLKHTGSNKFFYYLNILKSENLFLVFGNVIFSGTPYMKIKKIFFGK